MRKNWIESLPGMPPLPPCPETYSRPDRVTASFVEAGYVVEYFEYPFDRDRTVALLYGPGEFIIRTHPVFSTLQCLDNTNIVDFSYSNIFRTLRNFPESKFHYQKVKEQCEQKITHRLELAAIAGPQERLRFIRQTQPWVLKKVSGKIVAGYLGTTVSQLKVFLHSHPDK